MPSKSNSSKGGDKPNEIEMFLHPPVKPDTNDHPEDPKMVERARARHMTSAQEFWNAITMLLPVIICLLYTLSGKWLTDADIRAVAEATDPTGADGADPDGGGGCIRSHMFPGLHALPPVPTLCIVMGFVVHSPCSMYYHLACAFQLPPGLIRIDHWSRRLDQIMIHVLGMFWAYGLSGNPNYALALVAFNADSIYRLSQELRPKNAFFRQVILVCSWLLPMLLRREWLDSFLVAVIYGVGGWIFAVYPFGGWSHSVMHLVLILSNPIFLASSVKLAASEGSIDLAAKCALLRGVDPSV